MPIDETPRNPGVPESEFPTDFSSADALPGFDIIPQFPKVHPRDEHHRRTREILEARILVLQRRHNAVSIALLVIGVAALVALVLFLAIR